MIVTMQIVKRKEKGRKKRTNTRKEERTKEEKTQQLTQQENCTPKHARRRHCPVRAIAITQRQRIYDREEKEEKYMEAHAFRGQNKECSTTLEEKNILVLFFLDVVAAASYPSANSLLSLTL
jgi:hypothetical protein